MDREKYLDADTGLAHESTNTFSDLTGSQTHLDNIRLDRLKLSGVGANSASSEELTAGLMELGVLPQLQINSQDFVASVKDTGTQAGRTPSPDETSRPGEVPRPGETLQTKIIVDGSDRAFFVHAPAGWDGKTPLPVMYFFHGLTPGTGMPLDTITDLSQQSDQNGFLLVDMIGTGSVLHAFNNGQALFSAQGQNENNFLNSVHDRLRSLFPLDETRQGLTGFSEGGSEAFDLAAKNDWISSIQSVEGFMTGKEAPLHRSISAQIINADKDPVIPIGGTPENDVRSKDPVKATVDGVVDGIKATPAGSGNIFDQLAVKSEGGLLGGLAGFLDATIAPILQNQGNFIEPQQYAADAYNKADEVQTGKTATTTDTTDGDVIVTDSKNNNTQVEVKQVELKSGTHAWPESKSRWNDIPGIGEPNKNFDASEQIAQFFMQHKLGH